MSQKEVRESESATCSEGEQQPSSPASASASCPLGDDRLSQWKLFNDLETREENDLLELTSFLNALHEYMPSRGADDVASETQLSMMMSASQIDITDMYEGVQLDYPLTAQNAIDLVDFFKRHQTLRRDFVMQILFSALTILQEKPNINYLSIAPHPHMTVVGDLHGQLDDLLLIFRENGLPSPENPYIFNGDIVDRGKSSVECALIVLAFMIVYPDHVHVNRGNHEDKYINVSMGFMKECLAKYDAEVFDTFGYVFSWLPIATVLDSRILILHGGLPRRHTMLLSELDALPRSEYDVCRHKELTKTNAAAFHSNQTIKDILWSDPQMDNDWVENKRGAGINYGPNHVYKFMAHNHLDWIIRSHECVPQGYAWPYGDKGMLVTLFSASNYCGVAGNLGCFMHIPPTKDEKPSFFQYMATSSETDLVATNLEGLFDIIATHRAELLAQFQGADASGTNHIDIPTWEHGMEEVLQMKLNWTSIRSLVTSTESDHTINYVGFLNRYQPRGMDDADDDDVHEDTRVKRRQLFNGMYRYRKRLQALFQVFDQDGNGTINLDEFKAGIEILNHHLPPGMKPFTHPEDLMHEIDFSHDNEININEFMECFRIHANLTVQAKWRRARTKLRALQALGMLKVTSNASVITAHDVNLLDDEARQDASKDDISEVAMMASPDAVDSTPP
ncbi:Aste57867_17373 [Aphanomyces stellatus]|uniref:Serine/threonine-protein phosphatase n=1 Tax=Aphanomyces stellatus TaxID=120398 RepID=A0A485L7R4_9STRA|nr:hypothetical protein As57867_017313 [Aphanomyces stellatus]VFT94129.1 Aste57867_17373 [Aphanomyces stellatus]